MREDRYAAGMEIRRKVLGDAYVDRALDELRETLLQIAVYVGIPAGVDAFRIARRVLAEEGIQP